jgi:protein TonB
MFDLILDKVDRPYQRSSKGATVVSAIAHVVIIGSLLAIPALYVTEQLPDVPTMLAFVAPTPAAPPPPPPPPPPKAAAPAAKAAEKVDAPSVSPNAAPIEAPSDIRPEPATPPSTGGVEGGVEGGIEGGVVGGIVGGLTGGMVGPSVAPPPPPPPPPAPREPVRVGGQVTTPELVRRVDPEYPAVAVAAQLEGMVILEAVVDTDGRVREVRVLRSRGLLDKPAIAAVSQWRYAPLMLNGVPTPFVLTVTLNFSLKRGGPQDVG